MDYLLLRKEIKRFNGSNDSDDDVLDAFVNLTCDTKHYSDKDLKAVIKEYRLFESNNPEFVAMGDLWP
jgi:hypothetical protein